MRSQSVDDGRITADRTATLPNLDLLLRQVQARLEHRVSAHGLCAVFLVAMLALLAFSAWTTCCSLPADSVVVAQYRNSSAPGHLFESGAPDHAVTAIRYRLVSD